MSKDNIEELGSQRLSLFVPTLNGGGAERVMVTLANSFAVRGLKVDLVLAKAVGPYLNEVSSSVRVVDLNSNRVISSLFPLVKYLQEVRPLCMLSAMGHANVVALLARKLARIKMRVVVSEHGTITSLSREATSYSSMLTFFLIRKLYSGADGICAVSKAAADDLAMFTNLRKQAVTTIYNPFNLTRIQSLAREPLEHPWFKFGQPPVILAVGRLTGAKDFPSLIRAFSLLVREREVRMIILGEGELRETLVELIRTYKLSDSICLPGFVGNPYAWLARCSMFVLSSRWEGLPSVLIEAMACGAPVVSTACPSGPHEILEGGRWGKLVPVGDVDALANAMAQTLDTPISARPDVRKRASYFDECHAVDAYCSVLGVSEFLPQNSGNKV